MRAVAAAEEGGAEIRQILLLLVLVLVLVLVRLLVRRLVLLAIPRPRDAGVDEARAVPLRRLVPRSVIRRWRISRAIRR